MHRHHPSRETGGRAGLHRGGGLRVWLAGLATTYEDKIIGVDADVASAAGQMEAETISSGHAPGMADSIMAATARTHGYFIVTLNTRHFVPFDAHVASPDEAVSIVQS